MVTYNTVLSDAQYIAIAKKAANYYKESAKSAVIPAKFTEEPDALKYRHTLLTESKASEGVADLWSPQGPKATTSHGFVDYYLSGREMHLLIPKSNLNHYNDKNLLADKRAQEIKQFALDVDLAMFCGNYPDFNDRDAYMDAGGLITQNTSVVDLNGV